MRDGFTNFDNFITYRLAQTLLCAESTGHTWTANLDKDLFLDLLRLRDIANHQGRLAVILGRSSGQVCLMLFTLRMGQIGTLVDVEGQT